MATFALIRTTKAIATFLVTLTTLCVPVLHSCEQDENRLKGLGLPATVTFTHLPTDLSEMMEFHPIGGIRAIPNDHGGFATKNPHTFPPQVPVYAMSDGVIINIRKEGKVVGVGHNAPPQLVGTPYDDFALEIGVTSTALLIIGHISALSDLVLSQAGTIKAGRGVENRVNIKVQTGDIIGYLGPHPGFDIGLYDEKNDNYFVNRTRYNPQYMNAVSYTNYMAAEIRNQIWQINPRTIEPRGGKISYDVDGTLSGNWFRPGATMTDWSKQLIFARHSVYADKIAIADTSPLFDGDGQQNIDITNPIWCVKGNSPLPESITPESGLVKYAVADFWVGLSNDDFVPQGTVLVQLTDTRKLKFEYFDGLMPDAVAGFSVNAKVFER